LRNLAAELNIDESITWLGACDARPLMGAFDMLALTSVSEGHPLVVLEAMARGLPIVATAVGGISETVQHGVNGFIAPVRGVQEIATALEALVNDSELRERMGQASLTLSRNFSVDRMVDQTVALYEQVISGNKTPVASDLKMAASR
jgi:glycosyltransferase involved in cell wall biosynthesis